ncbi:MAG: sigma factor [Oscillospiraceae bacterium]|nr:sigma factor [Oscillospiraceae bacterium]
MLSMDEVYRTHAQTVYRYLLSLTRDAALAEELTQETFYQAVRSAERFDGSCKVSTWLCAIAKNVLSSER